MHDVRPSTLWLYVIEIREEDLPTDWLPLGGSFPETHQEVPTATKIPLVLFTQRDLEKDGTWVQVLKLRIQPSINYRSDFQWEWYHTLKGGFNFIGVILIIIVIRGYTGI